MSKKKPTVEEIRNALAGVGNDEWRNNILSHASIKNLAKAQELLDELKKEEEVRNNGSVAGNCRCA